MEEVGKNFSRENVGNVSYVLKIDKPKTICPQSFEMGHKNKSIP
jgi:hypothetical protein